MAQSFFFRFISIALLIAVGSLSHADAKARKSVPKRSQKRAPASVHHGKQAGGSSVDGDRPLKVSGQNRNLNMNLILRGESDQVDFGEVRQDYRREVMGTRH